MPAPDFIHVIDDVLSPNLCQALITQFEHCKNLQVGKTGGGVDLAMKRSMDVNISRHPDFAGLYQEVATATGNKLIDYFAEYYFALIGPITLTMADPDSKQAIKLNADNFATVGLPRIAQLVSHLFRIGEINAQRYTKGQGGYPYWHSENYPQANSTEALQRNLLFMFYLNDVSEGGETEFYYQQRKIQAKAGRMVIAPSGFTHTHRGNVPVSNDKYILTSWVMFNEGKHLFAR